MSELAKALAAFQSELPSIAKGETANTGTYSYDYADLAAVSAKVLPLLGKHGLAFTARPTFTDGRFVLLYALICGQEREEGVYPLPDKGTSQQLGSAITYARRYALLAVTGVAPGGEDDDGQQAEQAPTHAVRDHSAETPWDVPMANPGGHNRLAEINKKLNQLGVTDRGVKLGYVQTLVGRDLENAGQLTQDEQRYLLGVLEKCTGRDELDRLRDEATEAAHE